MKQKLSRRLLRCLTAAALAVGTLWTLSVTAGSANAAEAWGALRQTLPITLLRRELYRSAASDGLSPAAVLALSQSPLLLSARADISALRQQAEEESASPSPAPVTQPVEETPETPQTPSTAVDNGVQATTLVPTRSQRLHRPRPGLYPKLHPVYRLQ